MDKSLFSFDLVDTKIPDKVIEETLRQIEDATKGYVIGHIKEYDGKIYSYIEKRRSALANITFGTEEREIDIQDELGEIANEDHKFEVFLSVKGLEHYKYRLMFVNYGAISYPVTIVLNDALAEEYSGRKSYIFKIQSMSELNDLMETIINSDTLVSLIQSLIGEAMRQESSLQGI